MVRSAGCVRPWPGSSLRASGGVGGEPQAIDLAHRKHRQLPAHEETLGHLVVRQTLAQELSQLVLGRLGVAARHHESATDLLIERIGERHHCGHRHRRVGLERELDLAGIDVEAADLYIWPRRPTIRQLPSSRATATSPVWSHPSASIASAVASGRSK